MLLTDSQLQEIRQIIADYHSAFVVNMISPEAVAADVLARLKAKGLVRVQIGSVEDAYLLGAVAAAIGKPSVARMSHDQLLAHLKVNPVPLSVVERRAVQVAQHQAAQYVTGLGKRVDVETGQTLLTEDQALARRMRDTIRTATAEAVAKRKTAQQLKLDIGRATKDWSRDLDRIAITELHNAHQQGLADTLTEDFGPSVLVAKRPMPDACPHCKRLYLGPDNHPRIWELSQLETNGTNHKRKTADWVATLGALHPHCRCQLLHIPANWGFDSEGRLVPGGTGGVRAGSDEDFELALRLEDTLHKATEAGALLWRGIPIVLENAPGSVRHWRDPEGGEGATLMLVAYGYVRGAAGLDGDDLDVYVGPYLDAEQVYLVGQQDPAAGRYDEQKAMVGFRNAAEAEAVYRAHRTDPDASLVDIQALDVEQFLRWVGVATPREPSEPVGALPAPKFTIPLEKSELVSLSGGLAPWAISTTAGAHAPGPNSAVNFVFPVPQRTPAPKPEWDDMHPSPRQVVEGGKRKRRAVKRDKRVYDFDYPLESVAKPIVIPDTFIDFSTLDPEQAEKRKQMVIREGLRYQTRRPQNKVDVE